MGVFHLPRTSRRGERPIPAERYSRLYYLHHCGGHEAFQRSKGEELDVRLRIVLHLARISPGMCILDVGCGRGELVLHGAKVGASVWGMDYAWEALRISKGILRGPAGATRGRTGLLQGNAVRLPFKDKVFHRVLLSDLLEHLTREEMDETILEVHRVLRDDGRIVFHTFPNRWFYDVYYPLRRMFWDLPRGRAGPKDPRTHYERRLHAHELSPWELRRALGKGFHLRMWCAHRSLWSQQRGSFQRRWAWLSWIKEPEIWGVGVKRMDWIKSGWR